MAAGQATRRSPPPSSGPFPGTHFVSDGPKQRCGLQGCIHGFAHRLMTKRKGKYAIGQKGLILGREGVGTVTEVGPAVAGLKPGGLVVINPTQPCGLCPARRVGHERCLYRVPDSMSASQSSESRWRKPSGEPRYRGLLRVSVLPRAWRGSAMGSSGGIPLDCADVPGPSLQVRPRPAST
ncbi:MULTISPECIES: alcohol dehydrogenase catalytic domain-containing protein [Streptomyces]|uniref:alcohol dehydrogenase catalytic domain-containing protein n=2 Tax=Streptomyces TaxID=1883 RepID=UPI000996D342|nr:alcohol dehydrogenase catalytic domain-containing protein [Streptomyces sp. LBUM 1478]MBP5918304.1 alcohol dehydrogenase catalytic domain-containing protein [Streptomyces sp. LBUM 1486]MBP5933151.1 alcohol dehydrogenase catalytic domain-containing protein [Streptomyces sp. LBUM 1479]QTU52612.1 alcohol dehydrogenase catalytic domain-containing protein [Streptomyces sp. LBUM 1480]UJV45084.1 hypothetical protein CVT30_39270 [Streptomyces sp. AMCC400023]